MTQQHQNLLPFWKRFYIYQRERFPFLGHGALIAVFSFSAISYSRISRGLDTFIDWPAYLVCILNTIGIFFLVRIYDEFKDKEDDAMYRRYLPVPRGLIKLRELSIVGMSTLIILLMTNVFFNTLIFPLFFIVLLYLFLMGQEFFNPKWLKAHQFWYVASHMFIIPLVDILASGFDWRLAQVSAPAGLLFFFGVSYFNGIVLEIGRKIKTPETEEPGVLSYTTQLGTRRAIYFWMFFLTLTLGLAYLACWYAHHGMSEYIALSVIYVVCLIPAFLFLKKYTVRNAKMIEYASILWTFTMYLALGGIPMLVRLV